jgi:hypothetical protein
MTPKNLLAQVKQLDAQEMEEFLYGLAQYFTKNSQHLTNMQAVNIGDALKWAADLVKQRTGN